MTGVRNDTIWITNDPGGGGEGQTAGGAIATGVIGGLVEGGRRLFGGGEPKPETYEQQQRRLNYEAEIEAKRYTSEQAEKVRRRERTFRQNAGRITVQPWRMAEIKTKNAEDGNMPRRVYNKTHEYMQKLSGYSGSDKILAEMRDQKDDPNFVIKLSGLKWRSPDGQLNDHGIIDPGQLNLGWGGDYNFNMVWDESIPYHYRSAMAHLHRRVAEVYAVPADEAAVYVITEYINPGSSAGLKRFRQAGCVPTYDSSSVTDHDNNKISEYSILNMMAAELEELNKNGPPGSLDQPYKSPDEVIGEIAHRIRSRQAARESLVYRSAYLSTRGSVMKKAHGLMKRAMFSMEQSMDDLNFGHEQYIKINDACGREDNARIWACVKSLSEPAAEAAEDATVHAGTTSVLGKLDKKSVATIAVNGIHRVIKAGRKSPACRDALRQYQERACLNRVLPRGTVRVDGYPGNLYVQPENNETTANGEASVGNGGQ